MTNVRGNKYAKSDKDLVAQAYAELFDEFTTNKLEGRETSPGTLKALEILIEILWPEGSPGHTNKPNER